MSIEELIILSEQIRKTVEKELRQRGIDLAEMVDRSILEDELRPALEKEILQILKKHK